MKYYNTLICIDISQSFGNTRIHKNSYKRLFESISALVTQQRSFWWLKYGYRFLAICLEASQIVRMYGIAHIVFMHKYVLNAQFIFIPIVLVDNQKAFESKNVRIISFHVVLRQFNEEIYVPTLRVT